MSVLGLRVGPFEIVDTAPVPEAGAWFRATRVGLTERKPSSVLVKLLPPDASEADRAELQREMVRLNAVEDGRVPAVVALYEGIGALALDAPDGVSLADVIRARQEGTVAMTPATLLDVGLEVAETLQHAHHRSHFHGHLGAHHIRISMSGKVHVWGFGPGPGTVPAVGWAAPERARGLPATEATDQWSLAAILAGLITGHEPWRDGRDARTGDLEPTLEAVEQQWPALARLFRRMLEPEPANRFPSMHPVRQELLALARRAGSTSDRRELGRRMARRVDRQVVPDTQITGLPELPPLPPSPPPEEPSVPSPRDPADPPSLPAAERSEPPPAGPDVPLADEPLDVVSPDLDGADLPEARRPLDLAPMRPPPEEDEEDIDDDPTVRFDPLQARELAELADAPPLPKGTPAPAPRVSTPGPEALAGVIAPANPGRKVRRTISDEIDDDPETLARALAVAPDAGGAPTAIPITDPDLDELEELEPMSGTPIPAKPTAPKSATPPPLPSLPPVDLQEIGERPTQKQAGPDVRQLAPILVGVMVVLMVLVVLASLF